MTEAAYDWLRQFGKGRAFATKGMSRQTGNRVRLSKIDKMPGPKGRLIPGGILLWNINTDSFKDAVHYVWKVKLEIPAPFTFHTETTRDYIEHIMAEEKRRTGTGL